MTKILMWVLIALAAVVGVTFLLKFLEKRDLSF